jgi:hypothetical protein
MGVAVFLRLGIDALEEVVAMHGGTAVDSAFLLAARDEMKSVMEGEANLVLPSGQPGFPSANNEEVIGGAASGGAMQDPYEIGEDSAGKEQIFALFGAVGGVVATECFRMQTNSRQGVVAKGSATIYIPELGVELRTTDREDTVARGRVWLVVIRTTCKLKWDPLGGRNWVLSMRRYFLAMFEGLDLDVSERRPFQRSSHFLNNIREFKWATEPKIMGYLLAGNWGAAGVQISTFESSPGSSRSASSTADNVGRNSGLAKAVSNFMWYLAALFHEGYLLCLTAIVTAIERSDHLYMMHGRLLAYLIDKNVGGVFRALPLSSHFEIGGILYSLGGPRHVAAALQAAALQVASLFGDRSAMREQKILFDEEIDYHLANAKLISRIQQGSPAAEGSKKKKLSTGEDSHGDASVTFVPGRSGASPVKKGEKKIDYGGAKQTIKEEYSGVRTPTSKICVKFIASLLKVEDSKGAIIRCSHAKADCRFQHLGLKKVTAERALKSALGVNDMDIRKRVRAKIEASRDLFL